MYEYETNIYLTPNIILIMYNMVNMNPERNILQMLKFMGNSFIYKTKNILVFRKHKYVILEISLVLLFNSCQNSIFILWYKLIMIIEINCYFH